MPEPGRLVVCATPIGNLGDVTLRVLNALGEVDTILAEDTRVTRKLLARYKIEKPLERYDEFVAAKRTPEFVSRLEAGERLALVSDAGTPGISDPGSTLVDASLNAGVAVEVLPGPSAIVTALVASGLPTQAFYFGGFLPRKDGERRRLLASLASLDATLIFYESPRRTADALAVLAEAFGNRRGAMARELTKLHEEVARATVAELAAEVAQRETLKGEVVLLVGPPVAGEDVIDEDAVIARIEALVAEGMSRTAATKQAARELGIARNAAYGIAHRGAAGPH
ncbi:MAG TPA: 16S rRNA (cytidine(1402)-2'-O)-methyltransferase [Coriobacteriia bacterium]|nr:16S rRNA (cytidine(1402)-2'-O)-methyltransferase [Coriobacteriia bacterium]